MKIIYNKFIPFAGFKAINLFGVLFVREGSSAIKQKDITHESIHTAQMRELLYVPFYIIYFMEWLYRLCTTKNAYRSISFEVEAYSNQENSNYLKERKHFAQWRK